MLAHVLIGELEAAQKIGKPVYEQHSKIVKGDLDFSHRTVAVAVVLTNCIFLGKVDLRYCEFKQAVKFCDCAFVDEFDSGDETDSRTVYRKNLREPYNPGFLEFPTIVALHVVLGGVYLSLAPFQFVKRIRSRRPAYHRRAGRVLVAIGLAVGVTALFMGAVIPFSGWAERAIIGLFGTFFLFALFKGFVHVRAGRIDLHREWMIRAFAIGLSIATQRLIFVPAFFLVADPTLEQVQAISAAAFLTAFVAHAGVAEVWIRLTRKRRAPKAGGTRDTREPTPGSR